MLHELDDKWTVTIASFGEGRQQDDCPSSRGPSCKSASGMKRGDSLGPKHLHGQMSGRGEVVRDVV